METLVVGSMATNCYIAGGMIVDPGDDAEYIISHLVTKPTMIVATHGHFDHIMAAYALQLAYNIPFYIHEEDIFLLSRMQSSAKHFLGLKDVDPPPVPSKIKDLPFIHTPGHTPGSMCVYFKKDKVLFSGDTIFAGGGVGRTDFSYSDKTALTRSILTILSLPPETKIFPGHGDETDVTHELQYH
jgi:glyoxylase-like metal-dependent hydrolase (beta-lactamase superfamily II)